MISRPRLILLVILFGAIAHGPSMAATDTEEAEGLIQAEARKRFGEPLSEVQKALLKCVVEGSLYNPAPVGDKKSTIKADWIAWVCTSPKALPLVTRKGVLIENGIVEGILDLADAKIPFPLHIRNSSIPEKIELNDTEIRSLCLDGSTIGELFGRSMKVDFDIRMGDGFHASNIVDLSNAEIGGDLNLSGGKFSNPGKPALYADYMHVGRDLLMSVNYRKEGEVSNRFEAYGIVRLTGSLIDGAINCDGGQFDNNGQVALDIASITVKSNVHMSKKINDRPFSAIGMVEMSNARIGGNLYCEGGSFQGDGTHSGHAIRARGLDVAGDIEFKNKFKADGTVALTVAKVGGSLDCQGGTFHRPLLDHDKKPSNRVKVALDLRSATIGHDVHLGKGFTSDGAVNLERSAIGGNLDGCGGVFNYPDERAIDASGMVVKGSVLFGIPKQDRSGAETFQASGSVCLADARIGGDLECGGGQFHDKKKDGMALDASGAQVEGDANLNAGFEPIGQVKLFNASVSRNLRIAKVSQSQDQGMVLDLRAAKAGGFEHPKTGWPPAKNLLVEGFTYESVDEHSIVAEWSEWLRLQKAYAGGPHDHLAAVLLKSGRADDAKQILIDKEEWKGNAPSLDSSGGQAGFAVRMGRWVWYRMIGPIIRYGYGPEYSFGFGLMFVLLGWLIFSVAKRKDLFVQKDANPALPSRPFVPWLYSIDLFTPVISFYEREGWMLDLEPGPGKPLWALRLFRFYWMTHIVMGWVVTSLVVAGLLGLIHHD